MAKLRFDNDSRAWAMNTLSRLEENFQALSPVDTTGAEPLVSVLDTQNVFREDKAVKFIEREELLELAFEEYDGYFQVPKTID